MKRLGLSLLIVVFFLPALTSCSEEVKTQRVPTPRPVTVQFLKSSNPEMGRRVTGSVAPWKKEDIGFEVSGRIEFVVQENVEVKGKWVEGKKVFSKGDVVARIESKVYEYRKESAIAVLDSAKAQVKATEVSIEHALPAQVKEAKANATRATLQYEAIQKKFDGGAATKRELDDAVASRDAGAAKIELVEANIDVSKAELKAYQAQEKQAVEALKQAERDLANCVLYAPFDGQVADVHVIEGAYSNAGSPVVTLTMMDPLRVEVSVSAEVNRQLLTRRAFQLFPQGNGGPLPGFFQRSETGADTNTRTFNIELLVPNRRYSPDVPESSPLRELPTISDIFGLQRVRPDDLGSSLLVEETQCVHRDSKGPFVWTIDGFDPAVAQRPPGPKLLIKKVRVTLGEKRKRLGATYVFTEITEEPKEFSGRQAIPVAVNVPVSLSEQDTAEVLLLRERWLLNPGDVVPVQLDSPGPGEGYYVPITAVINEGESFFVFIVRDMGKAHVATRVPIQVTGEMDEFVQIEGEGLADGTPVIIEGTHYLIDDETVSIRASPTQA